MQAALTSKLVPVPACEANPVNDGLMKALNAVDAFLHAHKEAPEDLEQLKQQVKSLMLRAVVSIHMLSMYVNAFCYKTGAAGIASCESVANPTGQCHEGAQCVLHAACIPSPLNVDTLMPSSPAGMTDAHSCTFPSIQQDL